MFTLQRFNPIHFSVPSSPKKEIIPILEKDEGYFQIGNPQFCTDMFVLSVTVAFAANLEQVKFSLLSIILSPVSVTFDDQFME